MAEYLIQDTTLTAIADALREKTGVTGKIVVNEMAAQIETLPSGVETTVNLDFSNGDMEVTPAEGQAFEKVSIPTPANLIPENIAEGVDIAGIIGTLVAGGGSGRRVEYTHNSNGDIIKAKLINMPVWGGFRKFTTLEEIDASESPDITEIYEKGTWACPNLRSVILPPNLQKLGNYAFQECTSLSKITIPATTTNIGWRAFYGCSALSAVTFLDTSGWYVSTGSGATSGTTVSVGNAATAATMLKSTYRDYYWYDNT